jgi:enoyl-CoA hydratase/carnithine racemase
MTEAARPLDVYSKEYSLVDFQRSEDGILELRLHTDGGPMVWGRGAHVELERMWEDVALDQANQVVILTGTGEFFIGGTWAVDTITGGERRLPASKYGLSAGRRLIDGLLNVEVPIIAAVNGRCEVHAEQAVLCDIVLASETASFRDAAHFAAGLVPGGGIFGSWVEAIGLNRARYFILTGQELSAQKAYEFGAVNEVLPAEDLMSRARELAAMLLEKPPLARRLTRQLLVQGVKRRMLDELPLGLALAGMGATEFFPGGFAPPDRRMEGR